MSKLIRVGIDRFTKRQSRSSGHNHFTVIELKEYQGGLHLVDGDVFDVRTYLLKENGTIPNNDKLPLLVYVGAIELPEKSPASTCEAIFCANDWGGIWRNGIFGFHHYHSTAHEVLGVYRGTANVQFGGDNGVLVTVEAGDVIIIPAGVAHKNRGSSYDFGVVGAYPAGQNWDMNYGKANERPRADQNIARVPLPVKDPVFGTDGPLKQHWVYLTPTNQHASKADEKESNPD